ncbi:MAG: CBS domain-containing protein, partial [Chloroflexota bacterium]|nr:CBS domain-containing protein [Chloroflexota bacterium]
LLGYPPDTAGGRMTPSFVAVDRGATAGEAIETIRRSAREAETINYAYVLDEAGTLVGVLSLRGLLRSPPDRPVLEIMQRDVVSVTVDDDQETAGRTIARYNLLAVPVVEADGQMKGIITVDDIVEVMEEEASEDLGEVAGVYVGQGHGLTSGRLAGFGISLAGGVLAAVLLRTQRPLLASIAAMAWLLPPYLRMTQDLGTWSLARSLASSTLHPRRQMDVLAYEMLAALAGAAVTGGLVWGIGHILTGSASAALLMGIGIFVGTLAASLIGLGLPSVLRALKLHGLLARGRPLQVIVGLSGLVIYVWVLGSLAGRI